VGYKGSSWSIWTWGFSCNALIAFLNRSLSAEDGSRDMEVSAMIG